MEIDPGINSPSMGSRSPVKIEMKLSETHSLKFKKSSVISPSDDAGGPIQDDMHSDCFDEDYEGVPKYEEVKIQIANNNLREEYRSLAMM